MYEDAHLEMAFEDRVSGFDPHDVEDDPLSAGYVPSMFESEDDCEGHPAGPFDPLGETVYCDGSCRYIAVEGSAPVVRDDLLPPYDAQPDV
jgi:hypothetical protein